MSKLKIAVIVVVILFTHLFAYLQGRVNGFMIGWGHYEACIGPLEHAIIRVHIKNGAQVVIKTWQPGGSL